MMKPAVVFDIGNVLINVRHDLFHQFLLDNGVAVRSLDEFQRSIRLFDFECGRISSNAFLSGIRVMLGNNVSVDELAHQFNDMFTPADEMLDLLHQIRASHQVFLLSNTNDLHWRHLTKHYALDKAVHGYVVSFQAGVMKPDPRIYRYFMDQQGLRAEDIVFLDDRPENIEAANDLGWNAIHHISVPASRKKMLDFGIQIPIHADPIQ